MAKKNRRRSKKLNSKRQRANPYIRSKIYSLLPKSPYYQATKVVRRYKHPITSRIPLTARLILKRVRKRKLLHDRRFYRPPTDPVDERFGKTDQRHRYLFRTKTVRNNRKAGTTFRFSDPKRVEICKRRNARRQALFRTGKAGRGTKITTPKKLNQFSKIGC